MAKADSTSWKCKMLFSEATRDLAHYAVKKKRSVFPIKGFSRPSEACWARGSEWNERVFGVVRP